MPTDDRNKPREDNYSKVFRFGANQDGDRGITVSLAKYVRDFYSAQKMPFICEIRVSERASGTLANGLYHLFWNNEQPGEDKPSDEMRLLLAGFAEPHQKRFNKYFWMEKRAKSRSLSDTVASIFRSPWWALFLSDVSTIRLFVAPGRVGKG